MKELSIEKKAKAYEMALERAKLVIKSCGDNKGRISMIESIFPELAKSEDVLTWLTRYIEEEAYSLSMDIRDNEDCIKLEKLKKSLAWLKKQRTSEEAWQYVKDNHSSSEASDFQAAMNIAVAKAYDKGYNDGLKKQRERDNWAEELNTKIKELHKQCLAKIQEYVSPCEGCNNVKGCVTCVDGSEKAKITEKSIKPKFKVGDWLQYRNAKPFFVEEITEQGYVNGISCLPFNWENEIHLWTIQDAKEGDVLEFEDQERVVVGIVSFVNKITGKVDVSCLLDDNDNKFKIGNFYALDTINPHPATKEQRDLLFKKMKEAGYEWSSEHKKLIKNDACVALTKKMLYDIILDLKAFRDKDCSTERKAAYQREIDWLENLKKELEDSYDQ